MQANLLRVFQIRFAVLLSVMFSTILCPSEAKAGHKSGMNVTYECLGGDDYLVSINLFRNCGDSQELDSEIFVFIISTCAGGLQTEFPLVTLQEVSQLCDAELPNSTCNGALQPGMQLGVYQKVVQMPPCVDWRIIAVEGNRDGSIANLMNPGTNRIHVEAFLNNVEAPCNTAPSLSVTNIPFVCVGNEVVYNLGFVDADGDSLAYSLAPALTSPNPLMPSNIPYAAGYTANEPMNGMTIDPITGQLEVTPDLLGTYTVVVQVDEYRNGIKIGDVRLDFVFLVNACDIPPPTTTDEPFANISGGGYWVGENQIGVCPEDAFCFTLDFESIDPGVNVELSSNISTLIPGAIETATIGNPGVLEICGTIPPGFLGGSFIITALDDACPIYGQAYYAMEFVFREPLVAAGDGVFCDGVVADVSAINDTTYTWYHPDGNVLSIPGEASCNPCHSPGIIADSTGWYTVVGQYANSTCSNVDSVFIEVPLDMNTSFTNETCNGNDGTINIEVLSGSGNLDITWSDIGSGPLERTGLVSGLYQVLIIDDDHGCSKLLEFDIAQMVYPTSDAGADINVCGLTANLAANPSSGTPQWTQLDGGSISDLTSSTSQVTVSSAGTYRFVWTENSGGGCIDSDTVAVTFYDMPGISITAEDSLCGLEMNASVAVANGSFEWSGSGTMVISDPFSTDITLSVSQYGISTLNVDAVNGACSETVSRDVLFIEMPETFVDADFSVCSDQTSISGGETPGSGLWQLPNDINTLDPLPDLNIHLEADSYGLFELIRLSDNLGYCFDSDTVEVRFVEQPIVELEPELTACDSLIEASFTLPVGGLYWELPPELEGIPVVSSPTVFEGEYGTHQIILHADNDYGCIDSDTLQINLIEQPLAVAIPSDTVCGLEAELFAQGNADVSYWVEPAGAVLLSLTNPSNSASASVEGTYVFDWVLENGGTCRDTSHHEVVFYNQPDVEAGPNQVLCGLDTQLEGEPTYGVLTWTSNQAVLFDNPNSEVSGVSADWYGTSILTLSALNGICASSDQVEITFESQPAIQNEQWACTGADAEFVLTFDLAYGDSSLHTVSGIDGDIDDYTFTSVPIFSDTPVEAIFFDEGNCGGDTISDTWFCPVITNAGNMNLDTLHFCDALSAQADSAIDFALDLNDTLLFALHTLPESELGEVLAWNNEPSFSFEDSYDFETVYFISSVVGTAQTDGVDVSDPLLSVAPGTPIVFHQNPSAIIANDAQICPYDSIAIPLDLVGAFPQYLTYLYEGLEINDSIFEPGYEIMALDSGTYELVSLATDYCSGMVDGSVHISFFELPELTITGESEVCEGDYSLLELQPQGEGPFSFNLLLDELEVSSFNGVETASYEAYEGGLYQVANITDSRCTLTDTSDFYLLVKSLPIVDVGENLHACSGDTILVGTPAISPQVYQWEFNVGLLGVHSAQVEFTAENNGSFGEDYLLVLNAENNGCFDSDTVLVSVFAKPNAQIVGETQVCRGDSISLIGFGGTPQWSPATQVSNPNGLQTFFSGITDAVITLEVTTEFGCSAENTIEIEVLDAPDATFSASQLSGCIPFVVDFTADNQNQSDSFEWEIEAVEFTGKSSLSYVFEEEGTYEIGLVVTGENGCAQSSQRAFPVEAHDTYARFSFAEDRLSLSRPEAYFFNESPLDVTSIWSIDTLNSFSQRDVYYIFPDDQGFDYEVCLDVVSPEGCYDRYCKQVKIKDDFFLYVPNSFTPDGDGLNDMFYPVMSFADVKEYHFWIEDSQGRTIFDSTDPSEKWNGSLDGSEHYGQGTMYIWHLVVKPEFNVETQYYSGHVTAVR